MLLEYFLDWIKIVDFLLVAKFWTRKLFFTHPLYMYAHYQLSFH